MILTLSIARTVGYAAVGELTLDSVILCAASIPAMGVGLLVGDRIHTGLFWGQGSNLVQHRASRFRALTPNFHR
jgi:hypothetical protein